MKDIFVRLSHGAVLAHHRASSAIISTRWLSLVAGRTWAIALDGCCHTCLEFCASWRQAGDAQGDEITYSTTSRPCIDIN